MHQISSGIHQVSSRAVNSLVVDGDEGVVLIDTGLPKRHGPIVEALATIGREPASVACFGHSAPITSEAVDAFWRFAASLG